MITGQNIDSLIKDKEMLFRKSFVYVLDIIQYNELLIKKKKDIIAKQLLKAGTAFGEYINEAKNTQNYNYFRKKLKNSVNEAKKIQFLLLLCKYSDTYPKPNNLIPDIEELLELISNIQINN